MDDRVQYMFMKVPSVKGLAAARFMRDRDWFVLPTARKEEDLAKLKEEGFTPIRLDVADPVSVKEAFDKTLRLTDGRIGGLVNNAGFGQPGAIEDLTRDAMRYQFEVNVFGLQELTNYFIPIFRQQGFGRIVNISSIVGRLSIPIMGIYAASKFALEGMSDALRVELRGSGVAVSLVEPGPIITSFGKAARLRGEDQLDAVGPHFRDRYEKHLSKRKLEPGFFSKSPEAVAMKIRHALESSRPRRRYPVTAVAYIGTWMSRFMPTAVLDALMSKRL